MAEFLTFANDGYLNGGKNLSLSLRFSVYPSHLLGKTYCNRCYETGSLWNCQKLDFGGLFMAVRQHLGSKVEKILFSLSGRDLAVS